jgi:hypothetical protein
VRGSGAEIVLVGDSTSARLILLMRNSNGAVQAQAMERWAEYPFPIHLCQARQVEE